MCVSTCIYVYIYIYIYIYIYSHAPLVSRARSRLFMLSTLSLSPLSLSSLSVPLSLSLSLPLPLSVCLSFFLSHSFYLSVLFQFSVSQSLLSLLSPTHPPSPTSSPPSHPPPPPPTSSPGSIISAPRSTEPFNSEPKSKRKPQFSLGFLTICISRDLKFARFGGVAFADIKFITFRVKLKICDSFKSLTFPKEKQRFLHFGGYRGVKNDVGCFGRRQKTPPSKSPTLFLLGKCLIFLRKNNVF